jgi:hypothetical protein
MNKEAMVFRTHEIKSYLLNNNTKPEDSLFFYIKDNNFHKFKEIFERYKLSPEIIDSKGNTLLSLAVQCNCYSIVDYLLNKGAMVNVQNVKIYFY